MANEQLKDLLTNVPEEKISEFLSEDKVNTLNQLYDIQARYAPSNVFLPFAHNTYEVDLNTRKINGPAHLSVRRDHKAEVIYFKIDRYYDYMDLSNTICIIQYVIPSESIPRIYIVPFFDTSTCIKEGKILIPWVVGGAATSQAGKIEYSIRFYKIERQDSGDIKLIYNLSTLPASSEILYSLEGDGEIMNVAYDQEIGTYWQDLISQIKTAQTHWSIL